MLSIQFYSLGREGKVGAAPSVLLPPDVEPMPLDEALDTVRDTGDESLKRQAAWTLLRGTPHPPFGEHRKYALRYPAVLRDFCDEVDFDLEPFDDRRDAYRREARLFAGALVAFAQKETDAFRALERAIRKRAENGEGGPFANALANTKALGENSSVVAFLEFIGGLETQPRDDEGKKAKSSQQRCIDALSQLENDVGVSLETYIGEFADTVAFMELWQQSYERATNSRVIVYPAFTVAVQDTRTLTTMVTSTSLVTAPELKPLASAIDPLNWCRLSTTFRDVRYVDQSAHPEKAVGTSHGPTRLREQVRITAQEGGTDMGYFDNVLWVKLAVHEDDQNPKKGWADLDFTLHESVSSRLLWDERPGGLLVDGGWTKLRSIAEGLWRVTARKVLRFEDRTPDSGRDGPLDFGQALNYLAPAALSTWLEGDIYGGENPRFQPPDVEAEGSA
jgi:hypothetical protein